MFDAFRNRLIIEGYLVAESGLRVGTGRATELVGAELPVIRDNHGRPFIPGSSLKGALRGYLEAVARGMAPANADMKRIACEPTGENSMCVSADRMRALKKEHEGDDAGLTKALARELCPVCQIFGSSWLASPVRVRDLPVVADEWFGQFDVRDGVAIDRDKGTVAVGPYDYEVVPAGTRFELHIVAENLAEWQRGLLWLGLRALERGDVALGGFTSRGLGWVRLEETDELFIEGAQDMLVMMTGIEAGKMLGEDEAKSWVNAFRERLDGMNGKGAGDA
jgi:CRISPR-associated RAMP protein (TIGR02581 family)